MPPPSRNHFPLLSCLLAPLVTWLPLSAQVEWQAHPTPTSPPERNVGTMEYVLSLDRTFVYSGWHPSISLTDLWSWDGNSWTLLDAAAPPGMRFAHAMTYDIIRDRLVVFGGARGFYIDDTWELDCQTMTWTQMSPTNSPPARAGMSFAYDLARGVTVIFGGGDFGGSYGDTWEWDGTNWTQRTLAVEPPPRGNHAMTYDIHRQRVVLFGGMNNSVVFGDTWEYDGTNWTQRTPATTPQARGVHAMTWDADRRRVVMHGGNSNPWQTSGVGLDETWEWDGNDWSLRTTAAVPANSWQRCMTYDLSTRQVLLFGGGPARDELWTYEPTHRATVTALGVGCAGSLGTPALTTANTRPWLGETLTITVTPTPATGAALVSGLSSTGPIPLQPIGLPGCNAYVTLDSIVFAAAAGGAVTWNLPVPNQPGLLGFEWHQQAAVLDAGAAGGLAISNAITLRVGGL